MIEQQQQKKNCKIISGFSSQFPVLSNNNYNRTEQKLLLIVPMIDFEHTHTHVFDSSSISSRSSEIATTTS